MCKLKFLFFQVAKALAPDVSCSEGVDVTTNTSGKLVTSNGVVQIGNSDSFVDPVSPNKGPVQSHHINQSKGTDPTSKIETESNPVEVEKSETKSKQPTKRRGRKSYASTVKIEMSGQSQMDSEKEALEAPGSKNCVGEIGSSTSVDPSSNVADVPSQHEKETSQIPSQDTGQNEMPSPLPSLSEAHPEGNASKRSQRRTKKGSKNEEADLVSASVPVGSLSQDQVEEEVPPSTSVLAKKEFERTSDLETKRQKRTSRKALVENNDEERTSTRGDDAGMKKKESRGKQAKKSGKKVGIGVADEDEVSREDGKKNRGRGKRNLKKDLNGELSIKVLSCLSFSLFFNSGLSSIVFC